MRPALPSCLLRSWERRCASSRPLSFREVGEAGEEGAGLSTRRAGDPIVDLSEIELSPAGEEAKGTSVAGCVAPWLVPSGEAGSLMVVTRPTALESSPKAKATSSQAESGRWHAKNSRYSQALTSSRSPGSAVWVVTRDSFRRVADPHALQRGWPHRRHKNPLQFVQDVNRAHTLAQVAQSSSLTCVDIR